MIGVYNNELQSGSVKDKAQIELEADWSWRLNARNSKNIRANGGTSSISICREFRAINKRMSIQRWLSFQQSIVDVIWNHFKNFSVILQA